MMAVFWIWLKLWRDKKHWKQTEIIILKKMQLWCVLFCSLKASFWPLGIWNTDQTKFTQGDLSPLGAWEYFWECGPEIRTLVFYLWSNKLKIKFFVTIWALMYIAFIREYPGSPGAGGWGEYLTKFWWRYAAQLSKLWPCFSFPVPFSRPGL